MVSDVVNDVKDVSDHDRICLPLPGPAPSLLLTKRSPALMKYKLQIGSEPRPLHEPDV